MTLGLSDVREDVFCDSLWTGLYETCTQLLVVRNSAVRLIGRSKEFGRTAESAEAFCQLRELLIAAEWLPGDTSIIEHRGSDTVVVPNPHHGVSALKARIVLPRTPLAAAMLRAFTILRVRYQQSPRIGKPLALVLAPADDPAALDALYLVGDAFTERYSVRANLSRSGADVLLELIGEAAVVGEGLGWPRGDYLRCRDASLLMTPLWEAINGPKRPLAVPRNVEAGARVQVRVPQPARESVSGLAWLSDLQELAEVPAGDPLAEPGRCGEHWSHAPARNGFLHAHGNSGSSPLLPVRVTPQVQSQGGTPAFAHETADRLCVSFEGLGGVREIGANAYYYRFGRRGLLFDAGFDATREGWLGLPALERITRLDVLVLTHAHLDHVGAVPLLLAAFPNIPVYCTRATYELLDPTLMDSANVSRFRAKDTGEPPAITTCQVERMNPDRFRFVTFEQTVAVPEIPGLTLKFHDAGHMIGSLYTEMTFQGMTIAHTGDINLVDLSVQKGMRLDGKTADHLVMEGTYGYRWRERFGRADRKKTVDQFLAALAERIDAGGVVLAPAFSLGKAQEFVGLLDAWNRATGRRVPIRTAGMVNKINDLVRKRLIEFLPAFTEELFRDVRPIEIRVGDPKKRFDREARQEAATKELADAARQGPCVIVASHGMVAEGTNSYLLGRAILTSRDSRHAIFICGYVDPRTPGFRLYEQRDLPDIKFGENDSVPRTIPPERIERFSLTSHASFEELVEVADAVARRTLVLVHGESSGLDDLKKYLDDRYRQAGRSLTAHVPGIGERVVFGDVAIPADWDVDPLERNRFETLAPGRRDNKQHTFTVVGLTPDGRPKKDWALIPVGRDRLSLELKTDKIAPDRIQKVTLEEPFKPIVTLFDTATLTRTTDWRFHCRTPGRSKLTIAVADTGQITPSDILLHVGQEIRLVNTETSADFPVVDLEIGGTMAPHSWNLYAGTEELPVRNSRWIAESRLLQFELDPSARIGALHAIWAWVRWSNSAVQDGPELGEISLEPRVNFRPAVARVGSVAEIWAESSPTPIAVRVGVRAAEWDEGQIRFMPTQPGSHDILFEYLGLDENEMRLVGTINVLPVADARNPDFCERGQQFLVRILSVNAEFHGRELTLHVGDQTAGRWTAGPAGHEITAAAGDVVGPLTLAVREPEGSTLWLGSVDVLAGLTLDDQRSLPVTSADGKAFAEFAWLGMKEGDRDKLEAAFRAVGFTVAGWRDGTLLISGSAVTVGRRVVPLPGPDPTAFVWTLPSLEIQMHPKGPYQVGQVVELTVGGEPLDDEVLKWDIDRIAPVMDGLSVKWRDGRPELLHPGRYSIALTAAGRRLTETMAEVSFPAAPLVTGTGGLRQWHDHGIDAAVTRLESLPADEAVLTLALPGEILHHAQGSAAELAAVGTNWLRERLNAGEHVLVCWPGLTLPRLAGEWLAGVRADAADLTIAQLGYPAPRGELAADVARARRLRQNRVMCCLPAGTAIDREDDFVCPRCGDRPVLRTDHRTVWLACPRCPFEDRKTLLSLNDFRATDVRLLFAEYRMARYLTFGPGQRYGGAFTRTVRCKTCQRPQPAYLSPSPWERTELDRLLAALAASWNADDPERMVRRAADRVVRQRTRQIPEAHAKAENAIRRLLDAGVIVEGRPLATIDRLLRGMSLCCNAPLVSWRRPVTRLFVGVEQLLGPRPAAARHPGLPPGKSGLRVLLTVAE